MGAKETGFWPEGEQKAPSALTLRDLQILADKRQVNLSTSDYTSYTGVHVSRGYRMSKYEWRKFTAQLGGVGFVHIGGGNPWYGHIEDGTWRGLPYWDEPLGIAIELTNEQIE